MTIATKKKFHHAGVVMEPVSSSKINPKIVKISQTDYKYWKIIPKAVIMSEALVKR